MISITKDHLSEQNKKLTEENQKLHLLVFSLQKQLQNLALFIEKTHQLQCLVENLNVEISNLRKDNFQLQETILNTKLELEQNQRNHDSPDECDTDTIKQKYEEQLTFLNKENQRLQKMFKDTNSKQITSLQQSAAKLVELGTKIDQKLGDQSHRRILSNPTIQSPKGMSKEIYQSLIQQLSNQNDDKSILTSQTKLQDSALFNKSAYKQSKLPGVQFHLSEQNLPVIPNVIKK